MDDLLDLTPSPGIIIPAGSTVALGPVGAPPEECVTIGHTTEVVEHTPEFEVSWSKISTYTQCGEKFRLSYIEKAEREPQGSFVGGRAVHEMIEEAESEGKQTDRDWCADRFLHHFERMLAEEGPAERLRWAGRKTKDYPNGEDADWWRTQGVFMARRFCDVREEDAADGFQIARDHVEMRVRTQIGGHAVIGYIDAVLMVNSNGELAIRDYKTGKVGGGDGLQLAMYAIMSQAALGWEPWRGEYVFLRSPDKAKRRKRMNLRPLIPLIEPMVQALVKGRDAEVYPMSPSNFCGSCAVRHACAYGQTLSPAEPKEDVA